MIILPALAHWLRRVLCVGLASASLAPAAYAVTNEARVLELQTHEQRPWRLPSDLERVAIADPAVADLVMLKGRRDALLVGKSPGQTTLLFWHRGDATPQRMVVQVRSALQAQLQDGTGAQLSVHDGNALLQGSSPSVLDHEQTRDAAVQVVGDKGTIADTSTVASGGVVQVEVKIVEFNKTALRQLGLNFANTNGGFTYGMTGPSSGSGSSGSGSGSGSGSTGAVSSAFNLVARSIPGKWNASVNLLASNGMARVLAEPTLVALSGQSASFLAGGELPIPEPQGLGTTTITYKSFGIGLTVTPTVLSSSRIALKVAPEASDLDYSNGVTLDGVTVPAITTRRADTTVELGDGETFVIGGLVSQNTISQVSKIPLLGDIPIIGAFFRDLKYQKEDKELMIIVTPHLVKPFAKGTTVPLPGQREAQPNHPVWGSFLLNPAGSDQLPGFSR
ncbi:type II and III secretion system protein family protein [Rhodanobacter sp. Col0626]|uniref:type II and III secretion system protein family protein n=1 Tax=Rhodanobacter sp. Col0626 TaxID=3415679 RepID=UPI003CEEE59E